MLFNMKKFDLNKALMDVVEIARESNVGHQIILKGSVGRKIIGDEERIYQVISNLVSNAIKYSPNGGKVIIAVSDGGGEEVSVSFRDYGIGIDKKYQGKIFDKFFRAREDFPGLGIGLYLSSEIIRRHGGILKVESAKGKGSKFTFKIPYRPKNE